tara:strand:+ start:31397 stop:31684 length:288 start_codon:yes stop_codon:yes gene_type:complete
VQSTSNRLELDCAVGRFEKVGDGELVLESKVGVGGHSGFLGLTIGLEMLFFSIEEPRDVREDGPFPFIDSVSLDHENDRDPLVACAFLPGELGGV